MQLVELMCPGMELGQAWVASEGGRKSFELLEAVGIFPDPFLLQTSLRSLRASSSAKPGDCGLPVGTPV